MTESLERGAILQNRYRIERVLGKGGFGITYLVLDQETGQHVVIKEYFPMHLAVREKNEIEIRVCAPELEQEYSNGMQKFLTEARTMSSLSAVPEIVKVLNFFQENHGAYLVMEFVQGTSLRKYVECLDDMMSFDDVRKMMLPVIKGLGAVHKKGMIHRDLTPDNLLIKEDGSVKIIDFGSAREYVEDDKTKTVLVKSGYAPLEQYSKKEKQGPWTDVYSLCATMYEMLTGTVPQDALQRMEDDELYAPSLYGVEIQPEEEAVIMKGLSLDYRNRYSSMKELERALLPAEEQEQLQKKKKTRAGILAAAICVLVLGAAGAGLYSAKKEETKVLYAGSFDRASQEYVDFLAFIENNTIAQEDSEEGILYTLDKEAVQELGLPCNQWRFSVNKTQLLSYLEKLGYTVELEESVAEKYTADVHKYGAIVTNFFKTEIYRVGENIKIKLRTDAVNEDVLRVSPLMGAGSMEENADLAAELFMYLSEYDTETKEEFVKELIDTLKANHEAGAGLYSFTSLPDVDVMYDAVDAGHEVDYLIAPYGHFSFTSGMHVSYWP